MNRQATAWSRPDSAILPHASAPLSVSGRTHFPLPPVQTLGDGAVDLPPPPLRHEAFFTLHGPPPCYAVRMNGLAAHCSRQDVHEP
jgi:hypothetical protein